jgi:hypothetical protein
VSGSPSPVGLDLGDLAGRLLAGLEPYLPFAIAALVAAMVIASPLPGRGPGLQRRDPWRGFKHDARRTVLAQAGHRCEGALLLAWGRCRRPAEEVDHIYPWSKGGATIISNGQALCRDHNRSKSDRTPTWWYVLSLERRRRRYYPPGASIRVHAAMSAADKAARARTPT